MDVARCKCCKNTAASKTNFAATQSFTMPASPEVGDYAGDYVMHWGGGSGTIAGSWIAPQAHSYNNTTPLLLTDQGLMWWGRGQKYKMPIGQTFDKSPGAVNVLYLDHSIPPSFIDGWPETLTVTGSTQIFDCGTGEPPDFCDSWVLKVPTISPCCGQTESVSGQPSLAGKYQFLYGTFVLSPITTNQGGYGACEWEGWEQGACYFNSPGQGLAGFVPSCWNAPANTRTIHHNKYWWSLKVQGSNATLTFGAWLYGWSPPDNGGGGFIGSFADMGYGPENEGTLFNVSWYCIPDGGFVQTNPGTISYAVGYFVHGPQLIYSTDNFHPTCGTEFDLQENGLCPTAENIPAHIYTYPRKGIIV